MTDRPNSFDDRGAAATQRPRRPAPDRAVRRLDEVASRSLLWAAILAVVALLGGARGRRAALAGATGLALARLATSLLSRRRTPVPGRPDLVTVPKAGQAAAVAVAVGSRLPLLGPPLGVLAALVAYARSRVGGVPPGRLAVQLAVGAACGAVGTAVASLPGIDRVLRADLGPGVTT